ncbi:unnamed protein product [Brachionus calyciflorus]|uniref:Bromo domain-containing protein n=1 Tax=Brachionus calyciflorus TaxID=104777 RepID=A0A813VCH5_9BILA|nr:unnamed protein product [Brachionus calyciflorus]
MPPKKHKIVEEKPPEVEETDNIETSSITTPQTKRGRKSIKPEPVQSPPVEPKQSPSERQTRHKPKIEESQYYEDLFDVICSYQDDKQRYLANIFYVLPSKDEYPDYYELIKNPIDLNTVAKKILQNKYKNLRQLDSDLTLMFDNAKRYNDPKSLIYKDACKLRKLMKETCKELYDLQTRHKLFESNKTRDKKLKLLQEISEMVEDEEEEKQEVEEAHEEMKQPEQQEKEHEQSSDESEQSDGEEDEKTETKTPKRAKHNQKLISVMWSLFDFLKDQEITKPFLKLPPKRLYPDYYEDIKNPIAMNIIKKKLNKRQYHTLKDLIMDFELMFSNAQEYNLEGSPIYLDAIKLLNSVKTKAKDLEVEVTNIFEQNICLTSPSINHQSTSPKHKVNKKEPIEKVKKIESNLPKLEVKVTDILVSNSTSNVVPVVQGPVQVQVQAPVQVPSPKPQVTVSQPVVNLIPVQLHPIVEPVRIAEIPRQVQHRDAYIRYIANLRKMQQMEQTGALNNPMVNSIMFRSSDWYKGIDVNSAIRVKDSNKLPVSWIQNAKSNDVLQNLKSLRFYLLQDAVTIDKDLNDKIMSDQNEQSEEVAIEVNESEKSDENKQPTSLTAQ